MKRIQRTVKGVSAVFKPIWAGVRGCKAHRTRVAQCGGAAAVAAAVVTGAAVMVCRAQITDVRLAAQRLISELLVWIPHVAYILWYRVVHWGAAPPSPQRRALATGATVVGALAMMRHHKQHAAVPHGGAQRGPVAGRAGSGGEDGGVGVGGRHFQANSARAPASGAVGTGDSDSTTSSGGGSAASTDGSSSGSSHSTGLSSDPDTAAASGSSDPRRGGGGSSRGGGGGAVGAAPNPPQLRRRVTATPRTRATAKPARQSRRAATPPPGPKPSRTQQPQAEGPRTPAAPTTRRRVTRSASRRRKAELAAKIH